MLAEVTAEAAARFADRTAFTTHVGEPVSYAQLDMRRRTFARWLRERRQIGVGDVVVVLAPSRIEYVVAYAGINSIGGITAGVNTRLTAVEQQAILERAQPKLVLVHESLTHVVPDSIPSQILPDGLGLDWPSALMGADLDDPMVLPRDDERIECLVFTSGTTGIPKGAVFRDRQLRAIAAADWGADRWDGGAPHLVTTEFAHVGFMTKSPWYLMSGGLIQLLERWRARDVLQVLAEREIPIVGGVSAQLALLLRDITFDDYDWSHVKLIVMGGGPSSPALVTEARARFNADYSIRYSSTESGGVGTATAPDAPDAEALHTVGRARSGVELRVCGRNADGGLGDDLPAGQVGELLLRSPTMCDGYWHDDEATGEAFVDGWLRTGDLATMDETGLVRLAGRAREMFVRGGYNVYPIEVESVLVEHPNIAEVAVIGVPDDVMGSRGVAVIVPTLGALPPQVDELRSFAAPRLAEWKLPERVEVLDQLPRTAMDKVDRRALEAHLAS